MVCFNTLVPGTLWVFWKFQGIPSGVHLRAGMDQLLVGGNLSSCDAQHPLGALSCSQIEGRNSYC
jgi:hypothetical protein